MSKDIEKLVDWSAKLTNEQMAPLLVELIDFAIDAEMVSIGDAPYWSNTGEPLIEGQLPFAD